MATLTKRQNGDALRVRTVRGSDFGSNLYDPFTEQMRMMRRLANTVFNGNSLESPDGMPFPPIELYDRDDNVVLEVVVPGFKRDEIDVEATESKIDADRVQARLQDGLLTITLPRLSPTQAKRVAITV